VFSDISKAKQAEEKLFRLANHDTLTGLPNRMNFGEHLAVMLERAKRSSGNAAIAFIDLDRFKIIKRSNHGPVEIITRGVRKLPYTLAHCARRF
jgi:GGDEF domain-containing protein